MTGGGADGTGTEGAGGAGGAAGGGFFALEGVLNTSIAVSSAVLSCPVLCCAMPCARLGILERRVSPSWPLLAFCFCSASATTDVTPS